VILRWLPMVTMLNPGFDLECINPIMSSLPDATAGTGSTLDRIQEIG
jgi:hypothetical protein